MKACVLHAIGDLRYEEIATPQPKNGEVLMKVRACGVCGSDIPRVFTKGTYHFPTIPGHEFAGEIVAAGPGVEKSFIGKGAAVFPLIPCKKCTACEIGEYAQCEDYNYLGSRCDGAFAEYVAVPIWNLVFMPQGLSYEEAAMAEPAAVAIHALRRANISIGDSLLIFGAGPIGLMLRSWGKIWGAKKVLLVDIDQPKIDFAKKMGFENSFNSSQGDLLKWVADQTGPGADLVIEGTGSSSAFEQCLKTVRNFGKVVLMGNPIGDMKLTQKAYWEILRKQLTIYGTWNSSYCELPKNEWRLALDYMVNGRLNVKNLLTHRVGLENLGEALVMMRDRSGFFNKVMYVVK